ncbi:MAG: hypothetical protein KA140_02820 [Caldisericia bacterium]|nr:hypothetical protein [Caldisericia bacterium]
MEDTRNEKTIDIVVMCIMGLLALLPFGFWLASKGVFGSVSLVGKSDFSPWMDRMFMLGLAFWVMYSLSFIFIKEIKNRAPKIFGCVALFGVLSIAIIQFDNVLVPLSVENAIRDAANIWFFNLPYYVMRVLDANVPFNGMAWLAIGLMAAASGALLWWIKTEVAGKWIPAIKLWLGFEVTYFVLVWVFYIAIYGPIMFPPRI